MLTWAQVKFVSFHIPNSLINQFFQWEHEFERDGGFSFDTSGGGFGSGQLLRDWQLDFLSVRERRSAIEKLKDEIKEHRWTVAVLGKQAEVYVGLK